MRKRLAVALEPAMILIAGLMVAGYGCWISIGSQTTQSMLEWIAELVGAFLVGVSLAGGVALGVEIVRRRGERVPWGVGRWMWALSAVAIGSVAMNAAIETPLIRKRMYNDPTDLDTLIALVYDKLSWSLGDISLYLAAFLLARSLARHSIAAVRDGREMGGWVLAVAFIAWWIGSGSAYAYKFIRLVL